VTVLSAQSIRARCTVVERRGGVETFPPPMIGPFSERRVDPRSGMSYGLSSCGYDVRMGGDMTYPNGDCVYGTRAGDLRYCYVGLENEERISLHDGQLVVPPRSFVLAATVERFVLPLDVVMVVRDKSSWARQGIFVQNTVAEPGWRGWLTLEISNDSSRPIVLPPGCPIAQVMFERLDEPTEQPYPETGKYQDQAAGPQAHRRET
jgi:dCTP deaminase